MLTERGVKTTVRPPLIARWKTHQQTTTTQIRDLMANIKQRKLLKKMLSMVNIKDKQATLNMVRKLMEKSRKRKRRRKRLLRLRFSSLLTVTKASLEPTVVKQ